MFALWWKERRRAAHEDEGGKGEDAEESDAHGNADGYCRRCLQLRAARPKPSVAEWKDEDFHSD
jgi:hypothetical protein